MEEAAKAGVEVLALTDHDGVAGVPEAVEAGERLGIEIVPAVEMSSVHEYAEDLHICGYWVDVAGTQNARFPPFTRNLTEIGDWVDGAFEWLWDDVPDEYHDNNGLILEFLRENTEDF